MFNDYALYKSALLLLLLLLNPEHVHNDCTCHQGWHSENIVGHRMTIRQVISIGQIPNDVIRIQVPGWSRLVGKTAEHKSKHSDIPTYTCHGKK